MTRTNQSQATIALLQGLLRTIAPVTGDELREFCKGKITYFKIQKFKMREISIEEMGLKK